MCDTVSIRTAFQIYCIRFIAALKDIIGDAMTCLYGRHIRFLKIIESTSTNPIGELFFSPPPPLPLPLLLTSTLLNGNPSTTGN